MNAETQLAPWIENNDSRHRVAWVDPTLHGLGELTNQLAISGWGVKVGSWSELLKRDSADVVDQLLILGHGVAGRLYWEGAQVLGTGDISSTLTFSHAIQSFMPKDGDILIAGCNIGEGADGTELLKRLDELTGLEVWGSVNTTGSAEGADWILEKSSRQKTTLVIDGIYDWQYRLANLSNTTLTEDYTSTSDLTIGENVLVSGNIKITAPNITVESAISGNNDETYDQLTLNGYSELDGAAGNININANIAGGGINKITASAGGISLGENAVLSTRQVSSGGSYATAESNGDSGPITLTATGSAGQFPIPGLNIAAGNTSVSLSPGSALYSQSTGSYKAGDINISTSRSTYTAVFGITVDSTKADIRISGAEISGNSVAIQGSNEVLSYATSTFGTNSSGFMNNTIFTPLTTTIPSYLYSMILPASVAYSGTPTSIAIGESSVKAQKDITLGGTSIANASTSANTFVGQSGTTNGNFAVAVGVGQSSSSIDIRSSSISAPNGSVTITSTSSNPTTTTASVTGNIWNPDSGKNSLDAYGLAVTVAVTTTESSVSLDAASSVTSGGSISISSASTPSTTNTANSTIFLNGKASVGVGVAVDNATASVDILGALNAGTDQTGTKTFTIEDISADGSFQLSEGSYNTGTIVTYNITPGEANPFPTLVPGQKYMLLKNNSGPDKQTYFFQPSSVILTTSNTQQISEQPVNIQEPLQISINASSNTEGVLQTLANSKPLAFSTSTGINNNAITLNGHGLIQGQQVEWYPGPYTGTGSGIQIGGSPVASGQPFYAIVIDANTIKLAESPESAASGTALSISSPALPADISYTAGTTTLDTTTGIYTITNHGLTNNSPLIYLVPDGSIAIGGLTNNTTYYVIVINDNEFALAETSVKSASWTTDNQTQLTYTSQGEGGSSFTQGQDINLIVAENLRPASQSINTTGGQPPSSIITIENNGFGPGEYVTYTGNSFTNLVSGHGYFVSPIDTDNFQLCTDPYNAIEGTNPITLIANSESGTTTFTYGIPTISFDPTKAVNNNTSIITVPGHGLVTGDVVTYEINQSYTNEIQQPRYNGFQANNVDLTNSSITLSGSELTDNAQVVYQAGYLGAPGSVIEGLTNNTTYYVKVISSSSDGSQTVQLMAASDSTPITFSQNQTLSGFGAMQSLTSSMPITIGDVAIKGLVSGKQYNVIRLTDDEFMLTDSSAQLANPLTLNTSPSGEYGFTAETSTSGIAVKSSVTAKNKISVTGANGSNPKIKNLLANPALLATLNSSVGTVFNFANTKKELSKDKDGKDMTSTSGISAGGAVAVTYVDHTSDVSVANTVSATGNVTISSSITQTQQDQASTQTGSGSYTNSAGAKQNSSALSVAQILDFYRNSATTTLKSGGRVTAGGNVSITSSLIYPTIYKSGASPWEALVGKNTGSPNTYTNVSNAMQQWINLLFGGNLGLISAYFNTFSQTKNWGGYDKGKYQNTFDFAYVGIYQQFANESLTTLESGSTVSAGEAGKITISSTLEFNSLGAAGILNLSIDFDDLAKVYQGKPWSEVFSPFGNRASNGVGTSMVFQQNAQKAETIVQPGVNLSAGTGGIGITATNTSNPWLFAQAGGSSANFGLTGSFPFVTQSIITTAQLGGYGIVTTTGGLTIAATTNGLRLLGSGSMMWTNSIGVGIGATIYKEQQSTRAIIGLADNEVTADAGTNSGTRITSSASITTSLTTATSIIGSTLSQSATNSSGLFSLALAGVLSTAGEGGGNNGNPTSPNSITRSWGLGVSGSETYTSVGAYTQVAINAPITGSSINIGGNASISNSQTAYYQSGSGSILFNGGKQTSAAATAAGNGGLGLSTGFAQTVDNLAPGSGKSGIIASTSILIPSFTSGSLRVDNGGGFNPSISTGSIGLAGAIPFANQSNAWAVDAAGSWSQNILTTSNTINIGSSTTPTSIKATAGGVTIDAKSSPQIFALSGAAALVWNGRIAIAAGVSIADNTINQTTSVILNYSTVFGAAINNSSITISAEASDVSIRSVAYAGAFTATRQGAVAFDQPTTLALSGAGAGSYNTIENETSLISNFSQILSSGSTISLNHSESSEITVDGGGAALSFAVNQTGTKPTASASVGASISKNTISDKANGGISITNSSINAGSNVAPGAIEITSTLKATLSSTSIGGALAGAYSATGANSGALAGAGSGSDSTIDLRQPLTITNSTVNGSSISVIQTIEPSVDITSGGFAIAVNWAKQGVTGLSGALSVGASVSTSTVSVEAPLTINQSTLTATSEALTVQSKATPNLSMLSMGGALSFTAGQTTATSGALAGAGAGSTTTFTGDLSTTITSSSLTANKELSISKTDQPTIVSDAGGVAVGIALGSKYSGAVSVGASTAFNTVSLNDGQMITDSILKSGSDLSIAIVSTNKDNNQNGLLRAVTLGGSAAVGATTNGQVALAATGAGANSSNTFSPNLTVGINSSTLSSGGTISLSGTWNGDIVAKSGAYALGFSFSSGTAAISASVGASLASNTIETIEGLKPGIGIVSQGANTLNSAFGTKLNAGFVGSTTTQAISGAVAIAGSTGGWALALTGAGSQADTNIALPINADISVSNMQGGLSATATDNNSITTVAGSGALDVAAAKSVSVAVSAVAALATTTVNNTLSSSLTAEGASNTVNTGNQSVALSTIQQGALTTTAVAVAATISGSGTAAIGASGAGSNATTELTGSSAARLNGVHINAGTGSVSLNASDSRSINSDAGGYNLTGAGSGSVAVTVAIGASISSVSVKNSITTEMNGGSVEANALTLGTQASGDLSSLTAAGVLAAAIAADVGVAASGAGCGATFTSARRLTAQIIGGSGITLGSGGLTITNTDTTSISTDTVGVSISLAGGYAAVAVPISATKTTLNLNNTYYTGVGQSQDNPEQINQLAIDGAINVNTNANTSISKAHVVAVGAGAAIGLGAAVGGAVSVVNINLGESLNSSLFNVKGYGGSLATTTSLLLSLSPQTNTVGVSAGLVGATFGASQVNLTRSTTINETIAQCDVSLIGNASVSLIDAFSANATVTPVSVGVGGGAAAGAGGGIEISDQSTRNISIKKSSLKSTGDTDISITRNLNQLQSQNTTVSVAAGPVGAVGIGASNLSTTNTGTTVLTLEEASVYTDGTLSLNSTYSSPDQEINGTVTAISYGYYSVSVAGSSTTLLDTSNTELLLKQATLVAQGDMKINATTTGSATSQVEAASVSVGIGAGVGVNVAKSTYSPTTSVSITDQSYLQSASTLSVSSQLNPVSNGEQLSAQGALTSAVQSGGGLVSGQVSSSTAISGGSTTVDSDATSTITANGDISLSVSGSDVALTSSPVNVSIGGLGYGGVFSSATTGGKFKLNMSGAISSTTAGVSVNATVQTAAGGIANAVGVALGNVATNLATVTNRTELSITPSATASISAAENLELSADMISGTLADVQALTIGLLGVGVTNAEATDQSSLKINIDGDLSSLNGNITLSAERSSLSQSISAFSSTAGAQTFNYANNPGTQAISTASGGGLINVDAATSNAIDSSTTTINTSNGANLIASEGDIEQAVTGGTTTNSSATGVTVGLLVSVGVNRSSSYNHSTWSALIDGVGSIQSGGDITVSATPTGKITSNASASGGGVVGSNNIYATAEATPTVVSGMIAASSDATAEKINASGSYMQQATYTAQQLSSTTSGTTGGGIVWTNSNATTTWKPGITSLLPAETVLSTIDNITITATSVDGSSSGFSAQAGGNAYGAGSGAAIDSYLTISPSVTAGVGNTTTVTSTASDISIGANTQNNPASSGQMGYSSSSVGGIIVGATTNANGTYNPTVQATVGTNAKVSGQGGVNIISQSSDNISVGSSAGQAGLGGGFGGTATVSSTGASVTTEVGNGATLESLGGTVNLQSNPGYGIQTDARNETTSGFFGGNTTATSNGTINSSVNLGSSSTVNAKAVAIGTGLASGGANISSYASYIANWPAIANGDAYATNNLNHQSTVTLQGTINALSVDVLASVNAGSGGNLLSSATGYGNIPGMTIGAGAYGHGNNNSTLQSSLNFNAGAIINAEDVTLNSQIGNGGYSKSGEGMWKTNVVCGIPIYGHVNKTGGSFSTSGTTNFNGTINAGTVVILNAEPSTTAGTPTVTSDGPVTYSVVNTGGVNTLVVSDIPTSNSNTTSVQFTNGSNSVQSTINTPGTNTLLSTTYTNAPYWGGSTPSSVQFSIGLYDSSGNLIAAGNSAYSAISSFSVNGQSLNTSGSATTVTLSPGSQSPLAVSFNASTLNSANQTMVVQITPAGDQVSSVTTSSSTTLVLPSPYQVNTVPVTNTNSFTALGFQQQLQVNSTSASGQNITIPNPGASLASANNWQLLSTAPFSLITEPQTSTSSNVLIQQASLPSGSLATYYPVFTPSDGSSVTSFTVQAGSAGSLSSPLSNNSPTNLSFAFTPSQAGDYSLDLLTSNSATVNSWSVSASASLNSENVQAANTLSYAFTAAVSGDYTFTPINNGSTSLASLTISGGSLSPNTALNPAGSQSISLEAGSTYTINASGSTGSTLDPASVLVNWSSPSSALQIGGDSESLQGGTTYTYVIGGNALTDPDTGTPNVNILWSTSQGSATYLTTTLPSSGSPPIGVELGSANAPSTYLFRIETTVPLSSQSTISWYQPSTPIYQGQYTWNNSGSVPLSYDSGSGPTPFANNTNYSFIYNGDSTISIGQANSNGGFTPWNVSTPGSAAGGSYGWFTSVTQQSSSGNATPIWSNGVLTGFSAYVGDAYSTAFSSSSFSGTTAVSTDAVNSNLLTIQVPGSQPYSNPQNLQLFLDTFTPTTTIPDGTVLSAASSNLILSPTPPNGFNTTPTTTTTAIATTPAGVLSGPNQGSGTNEVQFTFKPSSSGSYLVGTNNSDLQSPLVSFTYSSSGGGIQSLQTVGANEINLSAGTEYTFLASAASSSDIQGDITLQWYGQQYQYTFSPPVNGTYYTGYSSTNAIPAGSSFSVTQSGINTFLNANGSTGVTLNTSDLAIYTFTSANPLIDDVTINWYVPQVSWQATSTYTAAQPSPANDGINRYFIGLDTPFQTQYDLISGSQALAANGSNSLAMTSGVPYQLQAVGDFGISLLDQPSLIWHLQSFSTYPSSPVGLTSETSSTVPTVQTTVTTTGTSTLTGNGSVNAVAGLAYVSISNTSSSALQIGAINTQSGTSDPSATIGTNEVQFPSTFTSNNSAIKFNTAGPVQTPLVIINNSSTDTTFTGSINAANGSVTVENETGSQIWTSSALSTSGSLTLSSLGSITLEQSAVTTIEDINGSTVTLSTPIAQNANQPLMLGFASDPSKTSSEGGLNSGALYNTAVGNTSVSLTPVSGQGASSTPDSNDIGLQLYAGAQLLASDKATLSAGLGIVVMGAAKLQGTNSLSLYLAPPSLQPNANAALINTGTSSTLDGWLSSSNTITVSGSNPSSTTTQFIGSDQVTLGRLLSDNSITIQLLGGVDDVILGLFPYTDDPRGLTTWLNGAITLGALEGANYSGPSADNGWEFNALSMNNQLSNSSSIGAINTSSISGLGMGSSGFINYNLDGTTSAGFTQQSLYLSEGSDDISINGNLPYTSSNISSFGNADTINLNSWNNQQGASLEINTGEGNDRVLVSAELLDNPAEPRAIPVISLGNGNNSLGPAAADTIRIGLQITADAGNNTIEGSISNDTFSFGLGDNIIDLLEGSDVITGGDGNNKVHLGPGNKLVNLGNGNNTVDNNSLSPFISTAPDIFTHTVGTGWGNDEITISSAKVIAAISAGAGNNSISVGNSNNNLLSSGLGSSRIEGGAGANTYSIGPGDNTIIANGGQASITTGGGGQSVILNDSTLSGGISFRPGTTSIEGSIPSGILTIVTGSGNTSVDIVNSSQDGQSVILGTGTNTVSLSNTSETTPSNSLTATTGTTVIKGESQVTVTSTSPNAQIVYETNSSVSGTNILASAFVGVARTFSDYSILSSVGLVDFQVSAASGRYSVAVNGVVNELSVGGNPILQDPSNVWQPLAAAIIDGSNTVLWLNTASNRLHKWFLNDQWQWLSSDGWIDPYSTEAYTLEQQFSLDLNFDGTIGDFYTTLASVGLVDFQVSAASGRYSVAVNGVVNELSVGGNPILQDPSNVWQPLAAAIIDGSNTVLWLNIASNRLHKWFLNDQWQWLSSDGWIDPYSTEAYTLEQQFSFDLNFDGTIGDFYTTLATVGLVDFQVSAASGRYSVAVNGVANELSVGGNPILQDPSNVWQPLAAAIIDGSNTVLWLNIASNRLHKWFLNDQWQWLSSDGWIDPYSTEAFTLEQQFSFDLNFDGTIGDFYTTLASVGLVDFQVSAASGRYSVAVNGVVNELSVGGNPILQDPSNVWQPLAAAIIDGSNTVLWLNTASNRLHKWFLNDQWQWLSSDGWIDPYSTEAYTLEQQFSFDLNFDGTIGDFYTTLATVGLVDFQVSAASGRYSVAVNGVVNELSFAGMPILQDPSNVWQPLAAAIIDGSNTVLWLNTASNRLHKWFLNDQWQWLSSDGWIDPYSTEAFTLEQRLGLDLNFDGFIGPLQSSPTA